MMLGYHLARAGIEVRSWAPRTDERMVGPGGLELLTSSVSRFSYPSTSGNFHASCDRVAGMPSACPPN